MKRREFLVTSAGLAGAMIPGIASAQNKPCPPPSVSVTGGTTATGTCSVDSAADWLARSTGPGVVWAHNFEHENEVLNFKINPLGQNDPSGSWEAANYPLQVRWDRTDGIAGGGCLEMICLQADDAYARDPTRPFSRGTWIRPFSPLASDGTRATGSGRGFSDPGASGTITPKTWTPATNAAACASFNAGVYGHSDYRTHPTRGEPAGWVWEGDQTTGYYLQFRVKIPQHRWVPTRLIPASNTYWSNTSDTVGGQPVAKYFWAGSVTNDNVYGGGRGQLTTPTHELVANGYPRLVNPPDPYTNKTTHQFRMYTTQGGYDIINTEWAGGNYWEWPADKWVTLLIHVVPGHYAAVASTSGGDTRVTVWAATSDSNNGDYVLLGDDADLGINYGPLATSTLPLGWNCFIPTNYANGPDNLAASPTEYRNPNSGRYANTDSYAVTQTWSNKFTQIIFSKEFIPSPKA